MRICELRRFLGDFVVFVNQPKDIERLKNDSRFKFHGNYKEVGGRHYGSEFRFGLGNHTIKEAKKWVEEILHEKRPSEIIV